MNKFFLPRRRHHIFSYTRTHCKSTPKLKAKNIRDMLLQAVLNTNKVSPVPFSLTRTVYILGLMLIKYEFNNESQFVALSLAALRSTHPACIFNTVSAN